MLVVDPVKSDADITSGGHSGCESINISRKSLFFIFSISLWFQRSVDHADPATNHSVNNVLIAQSGKLVFEGAHNILEPLDFSISEPILLFGRV